MLAYDFLIVGCPTWYIGQLQDDWDAVFLELDNLDFTGKKIAIFGLGDQYGYPDSFCDAIGILGRKFAKQGAELVGYTPAAALEFTDSLGIEDGVFMGLALDDENESERTPERITEWVWQLVDGQTVLAEPAACNYCGACESICPVQAIALPYQVILKPPDITSRQRFDVPYSTGKAPAGFHDGRRLR